MPDNDNQMDSRAGKEQELLDAIVKQARKLGEMLDAATTSVRDLQQTRADAEDQVRRNLSALSMADDCRRPSRTTASLP